MALEQAAHGHALLGNRARVDQIFDEMVTHLALVDDDQEHPWGGNRFHRSSPVIKMQKATCYGRLGLGEEAALIWDEALAGPAPGVRDRGVYVARWARALVDAGAPDAAVGLAADGVDALGQTGSARMRRELAELRRAAAPIDSAAGRELAGLLAPVA